MAYCNLKNIESGTFRAMKKLEHLSVSFNDLTTIADGTFKRFNKLIDLRMRRNRLTSVPDLTGLPAEMENILEATVPIPFLTWYAFSVSVQNDADVFSV
ncbi:hypothetical protein ACROYT_G002181 [Oculina patagonica]